MEDTIHKETIGNKTIELYYSSYDYLEDSRIGTFLFYHNKYSLGDEVPTKYDENNFDSWGEMEYMLSKDPKVKAFKRVYMYDHSGIALSTSEFGCRWDSGTLGYTVAFQSNIQECLGWKRVSAKRKEKLLEYLENEINTYDTIVQGDVYGYILYEDGEITDQCGGFIGANFENNGLLDEIPLEFHPSILNL